MLQTLSQDRVIVLLEVSQKTIQGPVTCPPLPDTKAPFQGCPLVPVLPLKPPPRLLSTQAPPPSSVYQAGSNHNLCTGSALSRPLDCDSRHLCLFPASQCQALGCSVQTCCASLRNPGSLLGSSVPRREDYPYPPYPLSSVYLLSHQTVNSLRSGNATAAFPASLSRHVIVAEKVLQDSWIFACRLLSP